MDLFTAMKTRKSTRAYKPDTVKREDLEEIVKAGSAAPLGIKRNAKMQLTVVQDKALMKAWAEDFAAQRQKPGLDPMYAAPALIIVSAAPIEGAPAIEYCNVGCVMENMALAATALGYSNIYLWGITVYLSNHPEEMKKLGIPEGLKPLSALALGWGEEEPKADRSWEMEIPTNFYGE